MQNYSAHNGGKNYIMTCIDFFSKFAWAVPIRNKTPEDVRGAFMKVVDYTEGVKPKVLITDNGGEFVGSAFETYLRNEGIKHVKTTSYTPQANGQIENFNKQLRKYIYEGFVRFNTLNYTQNLQKYLDNYNTTKHGTTKHDPAFLWVAGQDSFGQDEGAEIREEVGAKIQENARKMVARNKVRELEVGDYVRADMTALYSQLRKKHKDGTKKDIVVKWSPETYKIRSILKTDQEDTTLERKRYTLEDMEGNVVLTQIKYNNPNKTRGARRFFASQLKKVEKVDKPILSQSDTFKLNQIDKNDAEYKEVKKAEAKAKRTAKPKIKVEKPAQPKPSTIVETVKQGRVRQKPARYRD